MHSPVSHRFFFHHRFSTTDSSVVHGRFYDGAVVVVDGVFSVNGDLTASGGGAGFCEGIRTGGSSIGTGAVVVVDGGFEVNGFLTASGGGAGVCDWGEGIRTGGSSAAAGVVAVVEGRFDGCLT